MGRKRFAEIVGGYDVNAADVGLFPMATPTTRRDTDELGWAIGHNSSEKAEFK